MVKIVIENMGRKEIDNFTEGYTFMHYFSEAGIDWMHACGGKGRCTTCRTIVAKGGDQLKPETPAEIRYRSNGLLKDNERLACQAGVLGTCVIRVPDDTKLPHLDYTE